MAAASSEDRELTAALCRGETGAWAELCERFGGALYRFAFHLCGGESAWAEDVRQETLLAAAASIQSYRGEAPLFGWLCAIARRKAADELRRRGRMADPLPEDAGGADAWDHLETEPLPEDWMERAELRAKIVEALGSLPPEYHRLLLARYAEGLGVDILARRSGRSYKAVESMLARARAALRHQLIEVNHEGTK
ncbi:MAG: RNA polymerase sigma factor [Anaerolineales bacterium]